MRIEGLAGGVRVEWVASPTSEVRELVAELEEELSRHYPPEQRHGLAIEAIFQPHIRFFVAWLGETPVGCGGIAFFAEFAEVKRMYVREGARGRGVADAILARLEAESKAAGLAEIKLETGTEQGAAMRFYQRCGFEPCEAFEPYASMPPQAIATSAFFRKRVGA